MGVGSYARLPANASGALNGNEGKARLDVPSRGIGRLGIAPQNRLVQGKTSGRTSPGWAFRNALIFWPIPVDISVHINLVNATRLHLFNGEPAFEAASRHNPVTGCITMKTIEKLVKRFFPYSIL